MPAATAAPSAHPNAPAALNVAHYITPCLLRSIGFADKITADIPPDKFTFRAVPGANHPAFIVGHLALYPNRIFTLIGRKDLVVELPGWTELFQGGAPCLDDPAKYPDKNTLVKTMLDGYRKVAEILPGVGDDVFAQDNPFEGRFREIFPKVGIAVSFLCTSHLMMHLGQISTWRRAIGLGSVM